jgi:hypothetical protein
METDSNANPDELSTCFFGFVFAGGLAFESGAMDTVSKANSDELSTGAFSFGFAGGLTLDSEAIEMDSVAKSGDLLARFFGLVFAGGLTLDSEAIETDSDAGEDDLSVPLFGLGFEVGFAFGGDSPGEEIDSDAPRLGFAICDGAAENLEVSLPDIVEISKSRMDDSRFEFDLPAFPLAPVGGSDSLFLGLTNGVMSWLTSLSSIGCIAGGGSAFCPFGFIAGGSSTF